MAGGFEAGAAVPDGLEAGAGVTRCHTGAYQRRGQPRDARAIDAAADAQQLGAPATDPATRAGRGAAGARERTDLPRAGAATGTAAAGCARWGAGAARGAHEPGGGGPAGRPAGRARGADVDADRRIAGPARAVAAAGTNRRDDAPAGVQSSSTTLGGADPRRFGRDGLAARGTRSGAAWIVATVGGDAVGFDAVGFDSVRIATARAAAVGGAAVGSAAVGSAAVRVAAARSRDGRDLRRRAAAGDNQPGPRARANRGAHHRIGPIDRGFGAAADER